MTWYVRSLHCSRGCLGVSLWIGEVKNLITGWFSRKSRSRTTQVLSKFWKVRTRNYRRCRRNKPIFLYGIKICDQIYCTGKFITARKSRMRLQRLAESMPRTTAHHTTGVGWPRWTRQHVTRAAKKVSAFANWPARQNRAADRAWRSVR